MPDGIDTPIQNDPLGILNAPAKASMQNDPLGILKKKDTPTSSNGSVTSSNGAPNSSPSPSLSNSDGDGWNLHPTAPVPTNKVTPSSIGAHPKGTDASGNTSWKKAAPVATQLAGTINPSIVPKPNSTTPDNFDINDLIIPDKQVKEAAQKLEESKQLNGVGDAKNYLSNSLHKNGASLVPVNNQLIPNGNQPDNSPTSADHTNLDNYTLESIKSNLNPNDQEQQLAYQKYQHTRNLDESIKSSPTLEDAALNFESTQNPLIKAQVAKMKDGNIKIPDAYNGQIVADFLSDSSVIEKTKTDPNFKKEYDKSAFNLYTNFPTYAKRVVGQKISQEREDLGMNNAVANVPVQSSTDDLVDKMVETGKLTSQEKVVYQNQIRPLLGVQNSIARGLGNIVSPATTDSSPIATPDIASTFGESFKKTLGGAAQSIEDVTGLTNDNKRLGSTLQSDYSTISVNPKSLINQAGAATGNLGGMILPMILGGEVGKAAQLPELTSSLATNGLVFESQNYNKALTQFPDSPTKQLAYTTLGTAIDMAVGEALPTKEVSEATKNLLKDGVADVVDKFTDGEITAAAAKKSVLERTQQILGFGLNTAEKSAETGATMAGFSILHNGLNAAFGKRDVSMDDAINDAVQSFKSGFLGSGLLSGLQTMGEAKQKITGQAIQQMANNPDAAMDMINKSASLNPDLAATKDERIANLQEAVKVNGELNQTSLTDAQKQKFLLNDLAQKALERKAEYTTTDVIKNDLLKQSAEHQKIKEAIYKGKDTAPEFENSKVSSTPQVEENKGAATNAEGQPKEPNKVGVSHQSLSDIAKKLGLKEPERGTRLTNEEQADRGRQLLNAGADVGKLEKDFKDGKQPTADDISVARAHSEDLKKIADAMKEKWGKDSKQFNDANKEIDRFNNEVMKPMGSKTSEPFAALQGERDIDTGSFTSVKHAVEENKGKPVTPKEEQEIDALTTDNKNKKKASKDAETKLIVETEKDINEGQPSKNKGEKRKTKDDYVKQRKASFDAAREALKKLRGDAQGTLIPYARELAAIAPHIGNIVKSLIEEGVDNFKDVVDRIHDELKDHIQGLRKRDVMDLIAGDYGKKADKKTNPDTDKLNDIKKQAALTKKLQDLQNDLPEDLDKNKKEQTPEVKQLLEQIAKVRKYIDEYKGNPERRRIAALENKLEDLRNGTEKEPTPEREKSEKEKQLLEQIEQEKLNQGLKKLQSTFDGKKDNKFTPNEARDLWNYARKQYLDKGVPFNEIIKKVALDTGLTFKQVSEAITSPKTKKISDEVWQKQADIRKSNIKVKDYIESHNKDNPISKFFKAGSKFPKAITTAFHGHIFAGTHYPMGFVTPSQWGIYFEGIGKAWKNAYGKDGFHEKEVQALTSDPNYTLAKRAGLQNDVDNTNIDEFEKGGKIFGALGKTGAKGFLGMKWTRQAMFNDYWNRLSDSDKTDEVAKNIASLVNLATGASNLKIPDALQEGMFAAGMESARWGKIFNSPAKAIEKSTGILKDIIQGKEVKPEDKVFVKVWGSRVGQQLGTIASFLAVNALVQSKLNPKNPVNLTDPTKPDWLKFKADNTDIDLSGGTLGVKNFLTSIGTYAINDKNHKQEMGDIGGKSLQYARGKLSPLYGDIADVTSGTDLTGNPLPFSDKTPASGTHKLSWPEYLLQKSPIFIAEATKNLYDQAEQNGLTKSHTDKIVNGIIQSAITTGTGVRTGDSYQKPTPFSDDDYKDPVFKYFSKDWNMDLPNTSPSSETIKDENNGTKMKLSEYPQDVQDKYAETHKQNLHDELSDIKDNGEVYIKTYKDAQGNPISEVSLTMPTTGDYDEKDLDKLTQDEKAQVLRLAQDKATTKTKKDIFSN